MVKVKIEQYVEFCSVCPFGTVIGPVWDPETENEVYTIRCEKQNGKVVYDCLCWNECASRCSNHVGCLDTPPASCPFQPNQQ